MLIRLLPAVLDADPVDLAFVPIGHQHYFELDWRN